MTRTPRPFNPERGTEGAALFPDLPPETRSLIEGTAGCSPYLRGLMKREAEWISAAFDDPEAALANEYRRLRETAPTPALWRCGRASGAWRF